MGIMKNFFLRIFFILSVFIIQNSFAEEQLPKAAKGEVHFVTWGGEFFPEGTFAISGEAATKMWELLSNATVKPAVPNLETLVPGEISRDMVESRIGTNYICRKLPQFTKDGKKLDRGSDGKVIYYINCDFELQDVTKGIITTNLTTTK